MYEMSRVSDQAATPTGEDADCIPLNNELVAPFPRIRGSPNRGRLSPRKWKNGRKKVLLFCTLPLKLPANDRILILKILNSISKIRPPEMPHFGPRWRVAGFCCPLVAARQKA